MLLLHTAEHLKIICAWLSSAANGSGSDLSHKNLLSNLEPMQKTELLYCFNLIFLIQKG